MGGLEVYTGFTRPHFHPALYTPYIRFGSLRSLRVAIYEGVFGGWVI